MTREEVLDKKFMTDSAMSFDDYFDKTPPENISQDAAVFKYTIYEAMDEWAKIRSIGFIEFANKTHQYYIGATDDTKSMWFPRNRNEGWEKQIYTNDKMYNIFLQSQNKQ